jgi:hypothetical protein
MLSAGVFGVPSLQLQYFLRLKVVRLVGTGPSR